VKRKGRLYVVCEKVPKHKQRQGLVTQSDPHGAAVHESVETAAAPEHPRGFACDGETHAPPLERVGGVSLLGTWRLRRRAADLAPLIAR
jgi:large subunit ribosomal protein L36